MKIPVFPLPSSILFPGTCAPFHIFEERYKTMLKEVEKTGSDLAISYAPEWQPEQFFPHLVCGAGPVKVMRRLPGGESDILVFGVHRVKFHRFIQEVPYLIGEGEVLPMDREMPEQTEKELVAQIRDMVIQWVFSNVEDSTQAIQVFKSMEDLDMLSNFVVHHLVADLEKKQKLLEENRLENKAQSVWQILKDMGASEVQPGNNKIVLFPGPKGSGPQRGN